MTIDHERHKFELEDDLIQHMDMTVVHRMLMMMQVSNQSFDLVILRIYFLDDFDPETMDDPMDYDPKIGKKKILKLQAKAEKKQQREVKRIELQKNIFDFYFEYLARFSGTS
jgi:hypothetical protein